MDANGQRDSDVESERAWPSPAPNVPQFRRPNEAVPKKRVRQESDQPGTAHATGSRIKEEPIAEESSRRNNRERNHQAHSSGARIKAEPAEEAPELDRPPCEYTPRGSVAPRAAPFQFKMPRLESHSLDDVAPQMEDPLVAAQKQLDLKQQRIDTLKQRLKDQERELTLKFAEQLKKKEKELTLKHNNELLSQKVKYLEEINQKEQQINELLKSQVHQNQQQPTMTVPQYMMPAPPLFMPAPPTSSATNFTVPVPDSIHPNVPNPPQLVAPAPCPQASIPAPRAASLADSGRKTSVAPRESSSESMEPPQKKMRRDEQNSKVGDQPEEPQIQRFDEREDQRMEIGVVDEAEPNDDQEEIDFPDLEEQPEMDVAEPMEENDEMGPPQNEDLELDGNGEVQPAIGRRRSAREKHPVSLIQPKYGKNQIKSQRRGEHKRYKALHGGSYRKNKRRYKKRTGPTDAYRLLDFWSHGRAMTVLICYDSTIFQKVLSDKIACANPALQQKNLFVDHDFSMYPDNFVILFLFFLHNLSSIFFQGFLESHLNPSFCNIPPILFHFLLPFSILAFLFQMFFIIIVFIFYY
ncbi:hypothetical protein CRE_19567 [Caenorhabditis remanei]|uniref:Uncharacterized protein n=1 Tax=Caenorhabditis remanei TaxID=31234 RepID=E3NMZ1_CAERE|nr:hypothetical protein CRE_19567 [Caenorhabditis remanei]